MNPTTGGRQLLTTGELVGVKDRKYYTKDTEAQIISIVNQIVKKSISSRLAVVRVQNLITRILASYGIVIDE